MAEDAIQFVVRGDGRVTGEAFVSFGSPADSEVGPVLYDTWKLNLYISGLGVSVRGLV